MAVKLLALDLDGTTFGKGTTIADENLAALKQAQERGVLVAFVTGRRKKSTIAHNFSYADYVLMNNGGTLYRPDGECLERKMFTKEQFSFLLDFCRRHAITVQLYFEDDWWINTRSHENDEMAAFYLSLGEQPNYFTDISELPDDRIDGVIVSGEGRRRFLAELSKIRQDFFCTESSPNLIDVIPPGVNKWAGVSSLAKSVGVAPEEVLAVGNYYNDMEMLIGAGIGAAVANAPDDVKAVCDYVSGRTNEEHAVAEIVERLILSDT